MNKWYQTIIVNHKEEEGKTTHWLDEENYKTLCKERAEQLKEIDRLHFIINEVREHIEKTIEYEKSCGFNRWTYEDGQEIYIEMVEKTLDILDKGDKENI